MLKFSKPKTKTAYLIYDPEWRNQPYVTKLEEFLEFHTTTLAHCGCLLWHHTMKLGNKVCHNLIFTLVIYLGTLKLDLDLMLQNLASSFMSASLFHYVEPLLFANRQRWSDFYTSTVWPCERVWNFVKFDKKVDNEFLWHKVDFFIQGHILCFIPDSVLPMLASKNRAE